jgi:hypothetical protein
MSCLTLDALAEWALGEQTEADEEALEEHYFGCDACFARAQHMQRFVAQLRASLPPILTAERRQGLEARHPQLTRVHVQPGERATIRLGPAADVGFWVMHAPLQGVTRVDFEARSADGGLVFALSDVPFDRARGEVVLACQTHYRGLPGGSELRVQLVADEPTGSRPLGEYVLDHQFESL